MSENGNLKKGVETMKTKDIIIIGLLVLISCCILKLNTTIEKGMREISFSIGNTKGFLGNEVYKHYISSNMYKKNLDECKEHIDIYSKSYQEL